MATLWMIRWLLLELWLLWLVLPPPTGYTRALVASNVAIVATAGNTTTGDSYYGIDGSSADTAATLPIRVIDVVPESSYISSGTTYYYEFIVKINTHQYNNTTGV